MRLTIIDQEDGSMQVGIDGIFFDNLDGSQLPKNIHAVQWYDSFGEIEYEDPITRRPTYNEEIFSISQFQFAIDLWELTYSNLIAEEEAEAAKQSVEGQEDLV